MRIIQPERMRTALRRHRAGENKLRLPLILAVAAGTGAATAAAVSMALDLPQTAQGWSALAGAAALGGLIPTTTLWTAATYYGPNKPEYPERAGIKVIAACAAIAIAGAVAWGPHTPAFYLGAYPVLLLAATRLGTHVKAMANRTRRRPAKRRNRRR